MTVSYRDSHLNKGANYHDTFTMLPHRAMQWRMEQRLLSALARERFAGRKPTYLDFACGTGRILSYMAPQVSHAVGVDVAASMLAEARENAPGAELVATDLTAHDALGDRRFDLITAFRFFPNAESELRAATMRVLVRHLAPGGVLVFNNHKQEGSLLLRMAGALGRRSTPEEAARRGDFMMTRAEVDTMLHSAGIRMVARHPLAVLPFTDRHMLRPAWLLESLEKGVSRMPGSTALAQNVVYVCASATAR